MEDIIEDVLVREFLYASDDYTLELKLRDEVLRKPLGMNLFNDNLDPDKYDIHIGAFVGSELVGVLLLTKLDANLVKMRQVAVAEKYQSRQIGSKMVRFAERKAADAGFTSMVLHARKTAVRFYEVLGYTRVGAEFLEIGIPHFEMYKSIV